MAVFEKHRVEPNVLESTLYMQVQEETKLRKHWVHMVENQTEHNVEFELLSRGRSAVSGLLSLNTQFGSPSIFRRGASDRF